MTAHRGVRSGGPFEETMKRRLIALALMLFAAADARAQAPPLRISLTDAVTRGIEASHRLAELGARQDAARAVEDQRQSASKLQLTALGGYTRTNHVEEFRIPGGQVIYPDVPDNFRSRLDLQWPIYTGGRTAALTRAAAAETSAIAQDREAARADLKLDITRAYWAVITARAFAPLGKLLQLSARFSTRDTIWLLPKGRSAAQELAEQPPGVMAMFHVEQSRTDPDGGILIGQGTPQIR